MKRFFVFILSALIAVSMLSTVCSASGDRLYDEAGLLTQSERDYLSSLLDSESEKVGCNIAVVTVPTTGNMSVEGYADAFYQTYYSGDGVLLLLSMDEREYWISMFGKAWDALTDTRLDTIEDRMIPYLSGGDYASGFASFAKSCGTYIDSYNHGNRNLTTEIIVSLVIGLIIGLIVTGSMKRKLKSVRFEDEAANYVKDGSLHITSSNEIYLYNTVTRVARQTSSSGGGSRGTGGGGHGGRGGRF